jgi:4-carboxymuconolactone decarboxylase
MFTVPTAARASFGDTCFIALYRINELPLHLKRALDNGVTREEIIEIAALPIARRVFEQAGV